MRLETSGKVLGGITEQDKEKYRVWRGMEQMVKHIIFDIGNVLTDFRWRDFLREKGFEEAMVERIADATVRSDVWCEYDRGVWTDGQLLEAFVKNDPAIEKELRISFENFKGMVTIREYAIPWLKGLRAAGYHTWYLSNFSQKAETECGDSLAFMPYMDGGILSYRDRLIKPDPAVYKLLLERYGLAAQESVFIDDTLVNVEAAEKLGIHGIRFVTKEQADRELKELGVLWQEKEP